MWTLPLIAGLILGCATAPCAPTRAVEVTRSQAGYVTDAAGKQYALYDTGDNNIRTITDKIDGVFMKPLSYSISANHICKFWSESTRGVGYLIGEFRGPVDFGFGSDWAAFFECWDVAKTADIIRSENGSPGLVGRVLNADGVAVMLSVNNHIETFGGNDGRYKAKSFDLGGHHVCEFYINDSNGKVTRIGRWIGPIYGLFGNIFETDDYSLGSYRCWESPGTTLKSNVARSSEIAYGSAGTVFSTNGVTFVLNVSKGLAIIWQNGTDFKPASFHVASGYICNFYVQLVGEAPQDLGPILGPYENGFGDLFDVFKNLTGLYNCREAYQGPAGVVFDPHKEMFIMQITGEYTLISGKAGDFKPDAYYIEGGYACDFVGKHPNREEPQRSIGEWEGPYEGTFDWDGTLSGYYKCRVASKH